MNTNGVHVFDGTDDNGVVGGISHELKFVFLPTQDALFEENFTGGAGVDTVAGDTNEIFFVICKA